MNKKLNKVVIVFLLIFLFFSAKIALALDYNFESTYSIPIEMRILETISTKQGVLEGSVIKLRIAKTVMFQGQAVVRKGDVVTAKVETVVQKGMNGFPAEIIVDDFEINGINKSQLLSTYTQKGLNLCLFVYPLKWALTPIPFVGSLTNFIRGGEAKITPDDVITIQYFPYWK